MDTDEKSLKQRILEAAGERFLSEGFSSVRMEDLADALGVSKKTLYKHFPSKEDLINQLADRVMAEVRAYLGGIVQSDRSFVEKLHLFVSFFATQSTRLSRTFLRDVERYTPGLWTRIDEFRRERIKEFFGILIEQGVREGFVRPEVNPRIFYRVLTGAVGSLITPAVLSHESFSAHEAARGLITIFFRGILTDAGRTTLDELERTYQQP